MFRNALVCVGVASAAQAAFMDKPKHQLQKAAKLAQEYTSSVTIEIDLTPYVEKFAHTLVAKGKAVYQKDPGFWMDMGLSIEGLLFGFFGTQMPELKQCSISSYSIFWYAWDAIDNFIDGEYKTIAQGFHDLGYMTEHIPKAVLYCGLVDVDASSFDGLKRTFSSFTEFSYVVTTNLIFNGDEIWGDWDKSMAALNNNDYYEFGYEFGKAFDLVIQPADSIDASFAFVEIKDPTTFEDWVALVGGFALGAEQGFDQDMYNCIYDTVNGAFGGSVEITKKVVNQEKVEVNDAIVEAFNLVARTQTLKEDVQACANDSEGLKELDEIIDNGPAYLLRKVEMNVQTKKAKKEFKALFKSGEKEPEEFGQALGAYYAKLFFGF